MEQAREQGDLEDYIGNDALDVMCRTKAAELLPPKWEVNAYAAESKATRAHNRFVAQMLTAYDEVQANLLTQVKQTRREKASRKPIPTSMPKRAHQWAWDRTSRNWVCAACDLRVVRQTGRLGRTACSGHWGKVQKWCRMAEANRHCTYVSAKQSGEPGRIVTCTRCGLYAESFPRKLRDSCPGLRHTHKASRIRQGKHPRKKEWLYDHRRWSEGMAAFCQPAQPSLSDHQPAGTEPSTPDEAGRSNPHQAPGAPDGSLGGNHATEWAAEWEEDDPLGLGFALDEEDFQDEEA